jgi:hypothetical protein
MQSSCIPAYEGGSGKLNEPVWRVGRHFDRYAGSGRPTWAHHFAARGRRHGAAVLNHDALRTMTHFSNEGKCVPACLEGMAVPRLKFRLAHLPFLFHSTLME